MTGAFLPGYPYCGGSLKVLETSLWSTPRHGASATSCHPTLVRRVFDEAKAAAVVYGHIHVAYVREVGDQLLVNTGSVGLPFDGDPRASYVQLQPKQGRWTASLRRVSYNVGAAVRAARASDNPEGERWARRLETASARG